MHLDWSFAGGNQNGLESPLVDNKPIMILIPGFNNDSRELYIQTLLKQCAEDGYHTVCIGPRGLQFIGKLTSYHVQATGRDSDIREVIQYIEQKYC